MRKLNNELRKFHPFVEQLLVTNQIKQWSAHSYQDRINRLACFVCISGSQSRKCPLEVMFANDPERKQKEKRDCKTRNEIESLPDKQIVQFLNSVGSVNSYNSSLTFFRKFYGSLGGDDDPLAFLKKHYPLLRVMKKKKEDKDAQEQRYTVKEPVLDAFREACRNLRDTVIIEVLAEYGFRESELASVTIGGVVYDDKTGGYYLRCQESKTKIRRVLGIGCTALISQWLRQHPRKNDKKAGFICVTQNKGSANVGDAMDGRGIWGAFDKVRKRAIQSHPEIEDELRAVHPHTLRHYSATQDLKQRMSDSSVKTRHGWTKNSSMLARYSHVDEDDSNREYSKMQGVEQAEEEEKPAFRDCPKCHTHNRSTAHLCDNCGSPLDLKEALNLEKKVADLDEITDRVESATMDQLEDRIIQKLGEKFGKRLGLKPQEIAELLKAGE